MDILTKHWCKLSLNDLEGGDFRFNKERSMKKYIIAAIFLPNAL